MRRTTDRVCATTLNRDHPHLTLSPTPPPYLHMVQRLLFGPILIAALVGLLALDAWVDRLATPALLAHLKPLGLRDTFPPGTIILPAMVLIAILAVRELTAILRDKGIDSSKRINTTAAILGLLVSCLVPESLPGHVGSLLVSLCAVVVLVLALAFYSRHKTFQGIVAAAGGTLLAFVYLGLMFGYILAIRREHSVWILLWVLLVIKSSDIGAYFTGKSIGRHKLILWLSPGKTWEGLIGGMLFAALVAAVGIHFLRLHDPQGINLPAPWMALFAGATFAMLGQAGDLVMSLFKRDAGIKDSSSLLPGFGGVLDVLDSPLLVTPVAYWWLTFAMAR